MDLASLPGPPGFLGGPWIQVHRGFISGADIAAWPYSVGILIRFTFLNTLQWPAGDVDLGHCGVSFLDVLVFVEQWADHQLLSEKVTRPHVRANRPILIPSVPVSEGIEIRNGYQFLSSLARALAKLSGGLGRFLPRRVGSHMSRSRHLGWNQCSHGLTSRPLESCHHQCLKAVCGGFGLSQGGSFGASPTLQYSFAKRFPPWILPKVGNGSGKNSLLLLISWMVVVTRVRGSS